jgi:hypothetical protein
MDNCDTVISYWNKKSKDIFNLLRNNIGKKINFSNKDINCLSESMRNDNHLIRSQKCEECKKISLFLSHAVLEDCDEIEVKFGKYKGEYLNFYRSFYNFGEIDYSSKDKNISNNLNKQINLFLIDFYQIKNIFYYPVKNKFLNLSLISIIMKNIAEAKNFPNYHRFLNFFICHNHINITSLKYETEHLNSLIHNPIYVSPSKKNSVINRDIVKSILQQIILFYMFYDKFYFCHNEASIEFLKFNSELNNIEYEGKEIIAPLKVFIIPSGYSSISLYNSDNDIWSRYYYQEKNNILQCHNIVEDWYVTIEKNRKIVWDDYKNKKIIFYRLGRNAEKFIFARRNLGTPILYQSFDIICFICSLMAENYFSENIKNDKNLNLIWKNLWLEEDFSSLEKELKKLKNNNFNNIFNILKNYYIRSDALTYLKNKLLF